ncbi:MAG: type II toxin-antitoxin system Phd/YefM family antitoxin [Chloroflexota bacterium]
MKTIPLSEAKNNFSRIVAEVADRDERVMITRKGRPAAVMVSPEEFDSWLATIDILSDRELMAQFERSRRAMRHAKLYTVEELFAED